MAITLNGLKINGVTKSIRGVKLDGEVISDCKGIKFYQNGVLVGQYDFSSDVYIEYEISRSSLSLPGNDLIPLVYVADESQDWVTLPKDQSRSLTYGQNIWRGTSGLFRALIAQGNGLTEPLAAPSDLQVIPSKYTDSVYSIQTNENEADYPEDNLFRWQRNGSLSGANILSIQDRSAYTGEEGLNQFLTNIFNHSDCPSLNEDQPRFILIPSWVYCDGTAGEDNKITLNNGSYLQELNNNYPLVLFDESGKIAGDISGCNAAIISYNRYALAYAAGVAAAQAAANLDSSNPTIDIVIANNRRGDQNVLVTAIVQGIRSQSPNLQIQFIDLSAYNGTSPLLDLWQAAQNDLTNNSNFEQSNKIIITDWPEFFQYWGGGDWEENLGVYGIYFGSSPIVHRYNYWSDPVDGSISSVIQGPVSRSSEGRTSETLKSLIYEIYPSYNFNLASGVENLGTNARITEVLVGVPSASDGGDLISNHPLTNLTSIGQPEGEGYEGPVLSGPEGIDLSAITISCDAAGIYNNKNIFTYL